MLKRRTWGDQEALIATGPITAALRKNFSWALALARHGRVDFGPVLGGLLAEHLGRGWAYAVGTALYGVAVACTFRIRASRPATCHTPSEGSLKIWKFFT